MIPYGRQAISDADVDAVVRVLKSDWLTQGPTVPQFESAVAGRVGVGDVVVDGHVGGLGGHEVHGARAQRQRGEGLHHVALKVANLAATVAQLQANGARLLNDPRPGAGGHLYVFVHPSSTGGVLLELIQE